MNRLLWIASLAFLVTGSTGCAHRMGGCRSCGTCSTGACSSVHAIAASPVRAAVAKAAACSANLQTPDITQVVRAAQRHPWAGNKEA